MHSFSANILAGLFWFLFPVSLVICNDSMAYFCGMAFGRKFIKRDFLGALSPNKARAPLHTPRVHARLFRASATPLHAPRRASARPVRARLRPRTDLLRFLL